MQALTTTTRPALPPGHRHAHRDAASAASASTARTVDARGVRPTPQGGLFDGLLGQALPGVLGAASSLVGGDSAGALDQVRSTGASMAPGLVQGGATALGNAVGGSAGQVVSGLGGAAGQGVAGVLSGEQSAGQAASGLASAGMPAILSLLMSLLQR